MIVTLHVANKEGLSLGDALKVLKEAVGLFYSARECCFGLIANGAVTGPKGDALPLDACYEARLFHVDAELRWWNDPVEGKHRAALLAENAQVPEGWLEQEPIPVTDTADQSYLLWGQKVDTPTSWECWTTLTSARIGTLHVPTTGGEKFVLKAKEYFAEFADGNLAVAEERLIRLEPYHA